MCWDVFGEAGEHLGPHYNYSPQGPYVHLMNSVGLHLR